MELDKETISIFTLESLWGFRSIGHTPTEDFFRELPGFDDLFDFRVYRDRGLGAGIITFKTLGPNFMNLWGLIGKHQEVVYKDIAPLMDDLIIGHLYQLNPDPELICRRIELSVINEPKRSFVKFIGKIVLPSEYRSMLYRFKINLTSKANGRNN